MYFYFIFFCSFSTHCDNIYCLANILTTLVLRFVFVFVFTVFCFWLNNFTVKNNTVLSKQNKHRNYKKNNITLLREYIKKICMYIHAYIFFFLLCQTTMFKMYARLRWLGSTCVHIFASFSPVTKCARPGGLFSLLVFIFYVHISILHDILYCLLNSRTGARKSAEVRRDLGRRIDLESCCARNTDARIFSVLNQESSRRKFFFFFVHNFTVAKSLPTHHRGKKLFPS